MLSYKGENLYYVLFNPDDFYIPPLNWKTTKILGLPIIPGQG